MNFFAIMLNKAYALIAFPQPIIPSTFISFTVFISNIIQIILIIAGVLATIFLIVAGIQYISSGGDPTKSAAARQTIVNTIIGIIIIVIAFSIIAWVVSGVTSGRLI